VGVAASPHRWRHAAVQAGHWLPAPALCCNVASKPRRRSHGGSKAQIPLEYKKRSAEYWPECFTMPVAITASGQDKTVPPDSAVRFANAVRKLQPDNVLLIFREAAGHESSYEDSKAAFEFVLGSSSQTASTRRAAQESL